MKIFVALMGYVVTAGYESHREDGDDVHGEGVECEDGDAAVEGVECEDGEGSWESEDGSGAGRNAEGLGQFCQRT